MSDRLTGACTAVLLPVLATLCVAVALPAAADSKQPQIPARPLTLEDCTSLTLQTSPQIISARQSVITSRAALTRARSEYFADVQAAASDTVSGGTAGGDRDTERTQDVGLSVDQTLWRFGRREAIQQAEAHLRGAEAGYRAAVQDLIAQVAADYFSALAARHLIEVEEAAVKSARGHLEEVLARIELGVAPEVDRFTAEDDLARARLDLINARASYRVAVARLKTTMGLPVETDMELAEPPPLGEEAVPGRQEALARARAHSPDASQAREAVEAARKALRQAQIRRGPAPLLAGRYSTGLNDWEHGGSSWEVGLSISWPLFDGGKSASEVTSAQASLTRAEADLMNTINQTGLAVETALAEVERTRTRLQVSATSVAAAAARLGAAEGKYREGVGILLEVTDARAAHTAALVSQIQAEYDYRLALVRLRRALGDLAAPAPGNDAGRAQ